MYKLNVFKNINTIKRYSISILILLAMTVFALVKLVLPNFQHYLLQKSDYNEINRQIISMESKLNELETTDNQEISIISETLLSAVPIKNNYLAIFGGIKHLAETNNVSITSFQINPGLVGGDNAGEKTINSAEVLSIDLDIVGNLSSIRNMVNEIENGLPITKVSKLMFENERVASESAATITKEAKMVVSSYWQEFPDYLGDYEDSVDRLDKVDYEIFEKLKSFNPFTIGINITETSNQEVLVGRENPFPF